ncbi:hypothetical protein KLP28_08140 [Nocardioidaceae bacterium]|nr:hypothetical protein KLP28_08140 [Nocardioidaceae bacterium]
MSNPTQGDPDPSPVTGDGTRRADTASQPVVDDRLARERFGGLNLGASFFGWLVAVGVFVLLTGIVSAVLAGLDTSYDLQSRFDQLGTGEAGIIAGVALLVLLLLAYYTGGYVAGRMSRYDGKRQGGGVWAIGLLVTAAAAVAGVVFGERYNVLDRVELPTLPASADQVTIAGIAIGVGVLLLTLLAAVLGGAVGNRYHHKIDRAVDIR